MVTYVIIFIVLILALIFLPFIKALIKDKQELRQSPIEVRFKVLIDEINNAFLDGKGTTCYPVKNDNRWLNLHSSDKANYLIQFNYSTGHLTAYLNYKYFQKELNANVPFYNVRDADIFTQKRMANEFIGKMRQAIAEHQSTIGIPEENNMSNQNLSHDENDPLGMVTSIYSNMSDHQKRSVINMGYLIYSANGASWDEFVKFGATRQELNYLNVAWKQCQGQLNAEGEIAIYTDLKDMEDGVYDSLLMFWMSLVATQYGPNEMRAAKFISMNEKLGRNRYSLWSISKGTTPKTVDKRYMNRIKAVSLQHGTDKQYKHV